MGFCKLGMLLRQLTKNCSQLQWHQKKLMPLKPGPVWDFLSFSISCFTILRIFLRVTTAAAAPPIASGAAPG